MNATAPPILAGADVLPPMNAAGRASEPGQGEKPKRKRNRRKTSDRFRVLNAFVDFTAGTLTRSEILVWLVLFRDARDGIIRRVPFDSVFKLAIIVSPFVGLLQFRKTRPARRLCPTEATFRPGQTSLEIAESRRFRVPTP